MKTTITVEPVESMRDTCRVSVNYENPVHPHQPTDAAGRVGGYLVHCMDGMPGAVVHGLDMLVEHAARTTAPQVARGPDGRMVEINE